MFILFKNNAYAKYSIVVFHRNILGKLCMNKKKILKLMNFINILFPRHSPPLQ